MLSFKRALATTIGNKYIMSLTGFALVLFVIGHLLGNFALLRGDGGAAFNKYTELLVSFGLWLVVIEIGLLTVGLAHLVTAIWLKSKNLAARPEGYKHRLGTKDGPSYKNLSSTSMIWSGVILGVFIFLHVWQFKYGPSVTEGYVTTINGKEGRDLYRLVIETFHNPLYVGLYIAAMVTLWMHLRHGFWSAFQSMAIAYARFSKPIYGVGYVVASILAVGFIFIPLWIFFDLGKVLV